MCTPDYFCISLCSWSCVHTGSSRPIQQHRLCFFVPFCPHVCLAFLVGRCKISISLLAYLVQPSVGRAPPLLSLLHPLPHGAPSPSCSLQLLFGMMLTSTGIGHTTSNRWLVPMSLYPIQLRHQTPQVLARLWEVFPWPCWGSDLFPFARSL